MLCADGVSLCHVIRYPFFTFLTIASLRQRVQKNTGISCTSSPSLTPFFVGNTLWNSDGECLVSRHKGAGPSQPSAGPLPPSRYVSADPASGRGSGPSGCDVAAYPTNRPAGPCRQPPSTPSLSSVLRAPSYVLRQRPSGILLLPPGNARKHVHTPFLPFTRVALACKIYPK